MQLQIITSSMTPIYEQIADQIRVQIKEQILKPQELLPSVRSCARDCHISALTVKKAYDLRRIRPDRPGQRHLCQRHFGKSGA